MRIRNTRADAVRNDRAGVDDLLVWLKEIEELLQFPSVDGHVDRAGALALSIARAAPGGGIANLAMKVITEANALRRSPLPLRPSDGRLRKELRRLRLALEQARAG